MKLTIKMLLILVPLVLGACTDYSEIVKEMHDDLVEPSRGDSTLNSTTLNELK